MTTLKAIRAETMGCWWPSRANGRTKPDWVGIAGELEYLVDGERFYFTERGSDQARLDHVTALLAYAIEKTHDNNPR